MAIQTMNAEQFYDASPRTLAQNLSSWAPLLAFPLGLLIGALGLWAQPVKIAVTKLQPAELHTAK